MLGWPGLEAKRRWARVRGPLSATIVTLLELGWQPLQPNRWQSESLVFEVTADVADFGPLHTAIEETVSARIWVAADKHFDGRGASGGVDFQPILKHLGWLAKKGWTKSQGMLGTVAAGAAWTAHRCYETQIKTSRNH